MRGPRWYLSGPSLGPLHTVLASGGFTRRRNVQRPWWPRRWFTIRYWVLGIWSVEALYWTVYGIIWAAHRFFETWSGGEPV